jgi:hypothetical protein
MLNIYGSEEAAIGEMQPSSESKFPLRFDLKHPNLRIAGPGSLRVGGKKRRLPPLRYPLSKNISREGPRNCRSLHFATLRSGGQFILETILSVPRQHCRPDRSVLGFPATQHWTSPRVRLSVRERRIRCTNATKLNRKSGGA